jgi:hypothetical protein
MPTSLNRPDQKECGKPRSGYCGESKIQTGKQERSLRRDGREEKNAGKQSLIKNRGGVYETVQGGNAARFYEIFRRDRRLSFIRFIDLRMRKQ